MVERYRWLKSRQLEGSSKMKVILAAAATAAILAGAALAGTSSSGAPTLAQFNALSKRVATLTTAIAAVRKSNNDLVDYVNHCAGSFVAVTQYGDAKSGYLFTNGPGNTIDAS